MATFRAVHPFVREMAFKHGFMPVPGNNYRVQHPVMKGKKAQLAFHHAFLEASKMPGVRTVAAPGVISGRTLLFPSVPEERWVAARHGREYRPSGLSVTEVVETTKPSIASSSLGKLMTFTGSVDDQGRITRFDVSTVDDSTARTIMAATLFGRS